MNIQSAIIEGTNILHNKCINTAQLDAEILMTKAVGKDKKYLIVNNDKELSNEKLNLYKKLINERAKRKPIAYLINQKFFWKYNFFVNEDTLIPRPDTEILIEQILDITKNKNNLNILDIGVGSGCILLSILKEKKKFFRHRCRY